jgi:hypothetical protein
MNGDKRKFLFVSITGLISDIAWQVAKEGHEVRYCIEDEKERDIGDGFVPKVRYWEREVYWADVIVFDDTLGQGEKAQALRAKGNVVVGGTPYTDRLEDDRSFGQEELNRFAADRWSDQSRPGPCGDGSRKRPERGWRTFPSGCLCPPKDCVMGPQATQGCSVRYAWLPYCSYSNPVKTNKRNISVTFPYAGAQPRLARYTTDDPMAARSEFKSKPRRYQVQAFEVLPSCRTQRRESRNVSRQIRLQYLQGGYL